MGKSLGLVATGRTKAVLARSLGQGATIQQAMEEETAVAAPLVVGMAAIAPQRTEAMGLGQRLVEGEELVEEETRHWRRGKRCWLLRKGSRSLRWSAGSRRTGHTSHHWLPLSRCEALLTSRLVAGQSPTLGGR